jgi:hypothetical protein
MKATRAVNSGNDEENQAETDKSKNENYSRLDTPGF